MRARAVIVAFMALASCQRDDRTSGQRALDDAEARYARNHPVGQFQIVRGDGMHAVWVLDTTSGYITACNMEIVQYRTWCGAATNAMRGKGPPDRSAAATEAMGAAFSNEQ